VKTLALFDFDGTITKEDTLLTFTKYYHGTIKFAFGLLILSPIIILHLLKIIPNQKTKEIFLTWFFKNEGIQSFNKHGINFSSVIEKIIRPKARIELLKYKALGAQITIVTASPENWVKPWCTINGFSCIGTKLKISNEKITGKIDGLNCFGSEKENRIKSVLNLSQFDQIIAFGDSSGDIEMLNLAHKKFYKPFRN
jgi:phosphatidylglycerophosphatase C